MREREREREREMRERERGKQTERGALTATPCIDLELLSSEYGTHKTVTVRFWPWLSGESPQNLARCSVIAWKRGA